MADHSLPDRPSPTSAGAPARPFAARARELLDQLTPGERLALLHQHAAPVPRVELGPFRTGTEGLHGVAWLGTATTFPQPVGLAATWDAELLERVGAAVGTEVRAKHAADPTVSLNVWAPVVNPLRHPRWGRNEEGFSEDPHLTAHLATAYARGLRGDHPTYWRTVPTLKHLVAYGNETDRSVTSAQLSPRVLHEYELPAFRGPIEAGVVGALMPSYNLVNGRPNHVARELLDEVRGWTPASLFVVSDAGAPTNLVVGERYYDDHVEAAAAAVRAGVDSFTDHDADPTRTIAHLSAALERGLLDQADVDRAALRQLELRLATGELDPALDPWASITAADLDLPASRALAREAATRAVVVLENDGVLPLRPGARVAVVGPHADQVLADWYSGTPPYTVSIAEALAPAHVVTGADTVALWSRTTGAYVDAGADGTLVATSRTAAHHDVTDWGEGILTLRSAASGLLWTGAGWILRADASSVHGWVAQESFRAHRHDDGSVSLQHAGSGRWLMVQRDGGVLVADAPTAASAERFTLRTVASGTARAVDAARDADVVVLAVGNDPHLLGRETEDRPHLRLPESQAELARAVLEANPSTVLVVVSSYPYVLGALGDEAAAVVWTAHGGQELGHGVADVLRGDAEPYGRLAQAWPEAEQDAGDLLDYDVIGGGLTHWYAPRPARWAFGHGLSYSTVAFEAIDEVAGSVRVTVRNTGDRPVDELVQVYAAAPEHRLPVPHRRLVAHRRVRLAPAQTAVVALDVAADAFAVWDVTRGRFVVEPGRYELHAGPSSADLPLVIPVDVPGEPVPARSLDAWVRAIDHDDREDVTFAEHTRETGDALEVTRGRRSGWVLFRAVDLTGVGHVELTVARGGSVRVEVRDGRGWRLLGTASAPSGGRYDWSSVELPVAADGVHDVRLVLVGEIRLGSLRGRV
ncbi:glycoside hydrolase family 3 C-terminal domain-containing protein [Cellulomonas sp. Leaf334]|uniref:glycoside hydrolase family 3 C-terminal domain-containing protein n=1 Tax=Cellulomonas sp. Leaf334 TaxID=1736339 RepID=UPI0006F346C7|nr:glycoside hydrolase family 3 C-terminal domain-containing protein [Cellulomonas sp. Leaf334]KQR07731.1 beta-glucosidase [Cellulomonas sp. Leaf334]